VVTTGGRGGGTNVEVGKITTGGIDALDTTGARNELGRGGGITEDSGGDTASEQMPKFGLHPDPQY
jgi:hypothetical protein